MTKDKIIDNLRDVLWDYYENVFWQTEAKNNEDEINRDRYCEENTKYALEKLEIN